LPRSASHASSTSRSPSGLTTWQTVLNRPKRVIYRWLC
jgi:hypothetical protein